MKAVRRCFHPIKTIRKLIFSLKDLLHVTLNVPDFSSAVANVNESMVDGLTGFTI
jgi:hypothetical protein